jgi:peptide/nickel transport system substrate-binding protein
LKVASNADIPTLDPHAKGDAPTLSFLLNFYETLVRRDEHLNIEPSLAVAWSNPSPTVTRFALRPGVTWQDGTPFTAADVVFSFHRAAMPLSEASVNLTTVKDVRAIDPLTVEVETKYPDPLLVAKTYGVAIMQEAWAKRGNATAPVDVNNDATTNAAQRTIMGTGPFILTRYEPGGTSVAVPNPRWWDKPRHNLTEVDYVAIANSATRTAALISGEIDVDLVLSPQDIDRISATHGLKVVASPEMRTIYIALDQSRDELLESNIKGRNPLKDIRVRRAIYEAIDIEAIHSKVMRGESRPTALMWAPGVVGYSKELDVRLPYDPEAARKLLADAGYPDGFEIGFDCPNDRYANDEQTCTAIATMLARIGIRVNLHVQGRARWFAKLLPDYKTSMTLFGWLPTGTYDAGHTLSGTIACRDPAQRRGLGNFGGYCNPQVDSLIKASEQEMDPQKRLQMLYDAARIHRDDIGHIPLHDTFIEWGVRQTVQVVQTPDNFFLWRYITVQ